MDFKSTTGLQGKLGILTAILGRLTSVLCWLQTFVSSFQIPSSSFPSVLAPCSYLFPQFLLVCWSFPALHGCSCHVSASLHPDSNHESPHPFLFLRCFHLSSYHFFFLTEKMGKLLQELLLPRFQGLISEKLPSSQDDALEMRCHSALSGKCLGVPKSLENLT